MPRESARIEDKRFSYSVYNGSLIRILVRTYLKQLQDTVLDTGYVPLDGVTSDCEHSSFAVSFFGFAVQSVSSGPCPVSRRTNDMLAG